MNTTTIAPTNQKPPSEPKRLDASKPQKVSYCIDLWLRDEQVKINSATIKERVEPVAQLSSEPMAVVCFGPSLNDTWEKLRDFKHIITCSGAHKFLTERGIIPTHHLEVDPRVHKVQLIGEPNDVTEYLIASACHPDVFRHLSGRKVKLWHVFSNEEESLRSLPHGEWAMMGGSSAGLRAMTMARFLGFTDLHIFGMDGCEGPSGKHAAFHPSQPKNHALTTYNGVEYRTTQSMLQCARETWHELNQMPDVTATFYGEGLVQAMAKDYVRQPPAKGSAIIGFNKPKLISPEYAELNKELHRTNLAYGVGGGKHAQTVIKLTDSLGSRSVLDYGCGKGYLAKHLPFPIWEYDPAVTDKSESPRPADLVVCTDVLEHIEPEKLDLVLDDLRRVTRKIGYFVIHTGPSSKSLSDGRNSHLIQQGREWWTKRLKNFFSVPDQTPKVSGPLLHYVVAPKTKTTT